MSKCHPCHPPVPTWPPDPRAGRGPADPGKGMVGKVLTGNGITAHSDGERDALIELCSQRLDAFRQQRGEEVFAHRSRHRPPISSSSNYRVHRCARGRCECCGAHEHQRALEVDHIIPRNQGASDAITNLQALCFRCNAGTLKGPGRRSALRSSSPVGRPRP